MIDSRNALKEVGSTIKTDNKIKIQKPTYIPRKLAFVFPPNNIFKLQ